MVCALPTCSRDTMRRPPDTNRRLWVRAMSEYEFVYGCGDTITCDDCSAIAENWFVSDSRAICDDCGEFYLQSIVGQVGV